MYCLYTCVCLYVCMYVHIPRICVILHCCRNVRSGTGYRSRIATRYEVDGLGVESRCGRDFSYPSRPAVERTQPPIPLVPDLFPGLKRPGCGVNTHPPSGAELKEILEL